MLNLVLVTKDAKYVTQESEYTFTTLKPSWVQCKSMHSSDCFLLILGEMEKLKNISHVLILQCSCSIPNLLSSSEKFGYHLIL